MEKFTANYAKTASRNFVIQNLKGEKRIRDKQYPVFCVLKNILHRGCPTIMSEYLQNEIGEIHKSPEFNKILYFIDTNTPKWESTIKGDSDKGEYPAKMFFEKEIPKYLGDFKFIQQLMVPEVLFSDITGVYSEKFIYQQVDFYLPHARLVIEIDGQQHKKDNITRINDKDRDEFLQKHGIATIRIKTTDMYKKSERYMQKIEAIRNRLVQYKRDLVDYKKQYLSPSYYDNEFNNKVMVAVATIRFQTAILCLLERGTIKLTDNEWNFNILNRDVENFAELAVEDIFIWLKHLFKLNKLEYVKPMVKINYINDESKFTYGENDINFDISLLRRWTDENEIHPNVFFIRTDYINHANYFRVSTSDPIKYNIINDGKDSDIPSLEFILKNLFGFDKYRDGQLPIIISSLSYNDTIGLLPTGAGKSLCYQIAGLLQPCISFIVCPIKSLMYDQKYNTDKRYITNTNYITGDQTADEKNIVSKNFAEGKYSFIWISPERFQIPDFREYLDKLNREQTIALAVIDEVHCLSEWGHDFRTSYLNLIKTIRKYCPSSALLGLTATASSFVLEDLKTEFELDTENIKTTLFSRDELKFHIKRDMGDGIDDKQIVLFNLLSSLNEEIEIFELDEDKTKSGLIFTSHVNGRFGCYQLANDISRKFNIKSQWYSGQIPMITSYSDGIKTKTPVMSSEDFDKYKRNIQDAFQENRFPLLVATKAFGMGIDKSNIRYTVHYGMPGSMESLYQEAGRAGRDREKANCYVIYTKEDMEDDELNLLFHPDTSIDEIKEIYDKYGYENGRDILRNFFFWLNGNRGVEYEFKVMSKIYSTYAKQDTTKLIECNKLGYSFTDTQKAIYKLSLLDIIEDWTIKSWNKGKQIIEVQFNKYDDESILKSTNNYIKKYDKEFKLIDENIIDKKFEKYTLIYKDESMVSYEKSMRILLEWSYDNIVYNRRQSIKNILELCDGYSDPDSFKERIESYFRFTEKTYMLDHIAQNPKDFDRWLQIFYKDDGTVGDVEDLAKEMKFVDADDLKGIRGSITRLLESYRYNTGLNYISGMTRLLLGEFDNQDGKYRLESALEQIMSYDENERNKILEKTLRIGKETNEEGKENLSELLCKYYPNNEFKIYDSLKDNYSLVQVLEGSTKTLQKVGGVLN